MQIVTRQQWGAAPPRGQYEPLRGAKGTAVHWFGGETPSGDHSECAGLVRGIQQGAFNRTDAWYSDIEYNLLACIHGYVFVGRGVGVMPAAQGTQGNQEYFAVCALTGPSGGWTSPTDELLNALCDAIDDFRQTGGAGTLVVPHRSLMQTDCPGDALAKWVQNGAHRPGSQPAPGGGGGTTHVVGKWPAWDSTLYGLAAHYYHDGEQWPRIYEANKGTIGDNPDSIEPGMKLIIP